MLIHKEMDKIQPQLPKQLVKTSQTIPVAESAVSKLTLGLCSNKLELANLLATADYRYIKLHVQVSGHYDNPSISELAGYMLKGQLLYFPQKVKLTVNGKLEI